jgi:hypothetical protein
MPSVRHLLSFTHLLILVQGTYGRGGGNFVKKPKSLAPTDASVKSSSVKSIGKISLLKRIAHVMPGSSQSKLSATSTSANQPPRGTTTRHTNSRQKLTKSHSLSQNSNKITSSRLSATYTPVIRMPPINLNTITPGTSEDERSDAGRSRTPFPPKDLLPLTSQQPSTDNESTAVNEAPPSDVSRTVNAPVVVVAPGERVRFTTMSDRSRRHTMMPPQPKRLEGLNQHDSKTLAALEGKPDGSIGAGHRNHHRLVSNDIECIKRGRRTTLAAPAISRSYSTRRPTSEFSPFTDKLSLNLNEQTRRWNRNATAATTLPSDPFNHLFTSCVISLILLVILAAGKDILYVVALLPVIITLAKHFLYLDNLGLYPPLMRENLESLLSI